MSSNRLSARGPNANAPAKLPGLQAIRVKDPETQKALEALREWVEVRLGSRGDKFEKAVTLREFEQLLADVFAKVADLRDFTGDIGTLRSTELASLPPLRAGAFAQVGADLFYCAGPAWKKVTLTAV